MSLSHLGRSGAWRAAAGRLQLLFKPWQQSSLSVSLQETQETAEQNRAGESCYTLVKRSLQVQSQENVRLSQIKDVKCGFRGNVHEMLSQHKDKSDQCLVRQSEVGQITLCESDSDTRSSLLNVNTLEQMNENNERLSEFKGLQGFS